MKRRRDPVRLRLFFCLAGFSLAFALLAGRAVELHLKPDPRVSRVLNLQGVRQVVVSPQRGKIYDAKGRVLAMSLALPSVFADPKAVRDARRFSEIVAPLLGSPRRSIEKKLGDRSRRFVWLKRRVDPGLRDKLASLDLEGLHLTSEGARLYPDGGLAAQVLGVVGGEGNGLEGLERSYDHLLRSRSLVVRTERDGRGRAIFSGRPVAAEPEPGADLHLTIDAALQHLVEKELFAAARESGSRAANAAVMDPADGRILAMASYPPVNPNRPERAPPALWRNRPVEEMYEPGSTFKIFSLAAALEEGAVSAGELIDCRKGGLRLNGKVIRTIAEHDWLTPAGVLKHSDNIGMSRIGLRVGARKMRDTLLAFGFGSRVGIDFPAEARGLLAKAEQWRPVDLANISFGQGVGATPIQMLAGLSAIANGGVRVRPYLVERARYLDGREIDLRRPDVARRAVSEATARTLRAWMEESVAPGGTGAQAAVGGYRVAGKTGTAQKIDPATKEYTRSKVVSSFMGFVPAERPRLAAIFVFDEPAREETGGMLAAPVFRRVAEAALGYLGVPPDRSGGEPGARLAHREDFASPAGFGGAVDFEDPPGGEEREPPSGGIPDFRGMTVREVLARAREESLQIRVEGSGVAARQELVGRKSAGAVVRVYFSPAAGI